MGPRRSQQKDELLSTSTVCAECLNTFSERTTPSRHLLLPFQRASGAAHWKPSRQRAWSACTACCHANCTQGAFQQRTTRCHYGVETVMACTQDVGIVSREGFLNPRNCPSGELQRSATITTRHGTDTRGTWILSRRPPLGEKQQGCERVPGTYSFRPDLMVTVSRPPQDPILVFEVRCRYIKKISPSSSSS